MRIYPLLAGLAASSAARELTFGQATTPLGLGKNFTGHSINFFRANFAKTINEQALFSAINSTLIKYNVGFILPPFQAIHLTARQTKLDLDDDYDLLYDAPINIGDPNFQTFTMDFDTGSSDIIVPGPECTVARGCPHTARYQEAGTKLQQNATYVYGGGKATGDEYQDAVTVAGLTVPKQDLLSVSSSSLFTSGDATYDGIFGMAFTGASGSNATTFMENLIANKQVSVPEFSFYLGRDFNGTTGNNSQLTLGGRDPTTYLGTVFNVPVVNETAWIVGMAGVNIGDGRSAGKTVSGLAGIDTGTSFIVAPLAALAPIFALIPGAVPIPVSSGTGGISNLVMYAYPCSTPAAYMPHFRLGGQSGAYFGIDPQDFSLGFVDGTFAQALASSEGKSTEDIAAEGLCLAALLGVENNVNPDLYVLGTPFLKSWTSIFHYGNQTTGTKPYVGFAKSVNCAGVGC